MVVVLCVVEFHPECTEFTKARSKKNNSRLVVLGVSMLRKRMHAHVRSGRAATTV